MKKIFFITTILCLNLLVSSQTVNLVGTLNNSTLTINMESSTNISQRIFGGIFFSISGASVTSFSANFGITEIASGTYGSNPGSQISFSSDTPIALGTFQLGGGPFIEGQVSISILLVDLGGINAAGSSSIVLPITLKSFTASKLEGNNALLNWSTSSEVDASHFELERSFDLQSWTTIDKQAARGQQGIETSYSFVDQNIIAQRSNDGVCYYRLGMVDLDLSRKTSDIRSINLDPLKETYYQAFPNPAKGVINVQLQVPNTQANMTDLILMDNAGRVHTKTAVSTNGITKIDVSDLPKGVYHLQVNTGTELLSKKVILVED